MAVSRVPVLKRCRSLDIDPIHIGINKKSRRVKKSARRKMSEYGIQLREKQRAKFIYGVLENQFRLTFDRATKKQGILGENLLILLELRLDNIAYRLGFAKTRREARQVVTHGHLLVNGKRVDIPSYTVKVGDVITLRVKSSEIVRLNDAKTRGIAIPGWLTLDTDKLEAKIVSEPTREQIDVPIEEHLIVELYSKA